MVKAFTRFATRFSFKGTLTVAFSVLLSMPAWHSAAQCTIAAETNPTLTVASGCANGSFRLGSGAFYDLPVASNTYYVFSWNSNGAPNMSAASFCATPLNGSGTAFNSNQTSWFSGSTTSLRVSSNRTSGTWNGTSGIMTYRHTEPAATSVNAAPSTVCTGTQVAIGASGGAFGTLYFQNTTYNGTNTGTTANPQNLIPPVGSTTYYWRSNNNGCWGPQGSATVSVSANTVGGSAGSTSTTTCINTTVGISLSGNLGTVNNWEGRFNGGAWSNIGFNGATSFTSPILNQVGVYEFRAAVVNSPCNGAYSNPIAVTVVAATVAGTAAPAVGNFCVGGNTTVSLSGNTGNVVSWERQVNGGGWVNIGNANLTSIATGILNTPGTYEYRANVQNAPCGALQSTVAVITVDPASIGGNANSTGTLICDGDAPTVSLTGHTGAVLFWERQVNGGGFNNIGNTGLTSFSTGPLSPGIYDYRAVVQSGTCPQATSSSISITVSGVSVGGSAVPQVPALCQGGSTNITLSGHTGTILNWEQQTNGGGWTNIGNAGLTVINSGALPAGNNEFRAVIQNGGCPAVSSTPAMINVDPTSVGGTLIANFTDVCAGSTVDMILSGEVGSILYWERQFNGGGWTNIGNPASNLLTTSPLTPDGIYEFRVVVQSGICVPATSNPVAITVNPYDDASFSYSSSVFCQGGTNPSPSIAQGGGTFSATPAGLSLDPLTGIINLNASAPGSYSITHTTSGVCPSSANQAITVVGSGDASFSYSDLNYCLTGANPSPSITTPGGTFSSSPAGLIFANTGTGEIDFTNSMSGSYYVTYTLPGICPSSETVTVNLLDLGNSAFAYADSTYCLDSGNDPSPSIGQFGGTFSSAPVGLVFTSNATGTINLSASSAGSYIVSYNSGGPCPTTSDQDITLNSVGDPQFSYGAASYCTNGTNPTPSVTTPGGTFTSSPAGLSFVSTATGEINLAGSQPGTYSVTYTLTGACTSSLSQTVTITDQGNSTFAYASNAYCLGGANNPSPTVAQFGGTFSASPLGLVFTNNQTGTIDLMTSSPNTYTITYTSGGVCPTTSSQVVTLNASGDPLFFYFASNFCQNATNPVPFVAQSGGGFTSIPAGLLFVSPSTGEISLATSQPGGYTVTYNTGGLCPATYTQNVLITENENATFNYAQASYCQYEPNPTPTVTQIGGTFTSSPAGLVFENQFTGKIDLAASTGGTYTVTYTVPGACAGVYTQQVTINAGAAASISYPATSFCSNGTDPLATVSPAGGTFGSSPLGLSIDASGTIDLSASVPGAYAVSYTAPGLCGTTATTNVIIVTSPQAFIQPINTLCTGSPTAIMTASPAGGTWSGGAYISPSGVFDPAVSGAGSFPVNYVVNGSGGCNASATYNVVVNASPSVNVTPAGPFCSNDSIQVLTASPLGGMWSGNPFVSINGLFFPAEAGPGVYPVMYTVNNGGCTGSAVASIQVLNAPNPVISPVAALCAGGSPIGLTANIAGGTWSGGPYITPGGTFDPALASIGNNTVTYTLNTGTCTAQSSAQIAVNGNPNVNIITPAPFCQDDSPAFLIVNIPGGVFTGGSYINGSGLFNPALASLGNNIVIYTLTGSNGCVGSDTVNVLVNDNPDATITYPGLVCETDPPFNLNAATSGGTWTGGAYVNNGIFDPAVAGPGSHNVTYDVTTGGCASTSSISITVDPTPLALFNYQPNGLLVYFTDLSFNVNSWLWNFGDGSPEVTDQNPVHTFPDNGIYQVRLIATNDCGSDTLIRGVSVNKSVSIDENTNNSSITVFPNPADQYIQINGSQLSVGELRMQILDISGKTVMNQVLFTADGTLNSTIDISILKPGVYFINLVEGDTIRTVKFVKM